MGGRLRWRRRRNRARSKCVKDKMIVARVRMEFADAGWMAAGDDARQLFERVARVGEVKTKEGAEMETMSLGELMYFALMERA